MGGTVQDLGAGEMTLQGGTILVVDDDRLVRDSVGRVLIAEGYTVRFAGDGAEALEAVRQSPPDAILLDVMMPNMNGREFLRTLREQREGADIPVLVMTAVPGIDTNRVFTLGATDLVEKPFDIDVLLNKVALAMFRSRARTVAGSEHSQLASVPQSERGLDADGPDRVIVAIAAPSESMESLDRLLSEQGCTLVSMARVTDDLTRLTSVLEPLAVVIDLAVDGGRGLAALAALRSHPRLTRVPVLVFASAGDIARHTTAIRSLSARPVSGAPTSVDLFSFVSGECNLRSAKPH